MDLSRTLGIAFQPEPWPTTLSEDRVQPDLRILGQPRALLVHQLPSLFPRTAVWILRRLDRGGLDTLRQAQDWSKSPRQP